MGQSPTADKGNACISKRSRVDGGWSADVARPRTSNHAIRWSLGLALRSKNPTTHRFPLTADSSPRVPLHLQHMEETVVCLLRKIKADRLSRPAMVEGAVGPEAEGRGMVTCLQTHSGHHPPRTSLPEYLQQDTGTRERCGKILLWRKWVVTGRKHPTAWTRSVSDESWAD